MSNTLHKDKKITDNLDSRPHVAGIFLSHKRGLRNHEVDRLRPFALLVRRDVECDALSFGQILQPGALDGRNVNKHVAATVVRFDEAVAAFSVEELDRPSHGHRETSPRIAPPLRPSCVSADRTFVADIFRRKLWPSRRACVTAVPP